MKRTQFALQLCVASLVAVQAHGGSARYFLSLTGLSDSNDDQSAAIIPPFMTHDPVFQTGGLNATVRLYLWADLSPLGTITPTDLTRIDLAFSTTGNFMITRTNIWQRTIQMDPDDPSAVFRRWASAPGMQTWESNYVDLAPAVAALEPG